MDYAEIYDGIWVVGIFAAIIWAAWVAHNRQIDESRKPLTENALLGQSGNEHEVHSARPDDVLHS